LRTELRCDLGGCHALWARKISARQRRERTWIASGHLSENPTLQMDQNGGW
jgi:hypothetical protein